MSLDSRQWPGSLNATRINASFGTVSGTQITATSGFAGQSFSGLLGVFSGLVVNGVLSGVTISFSGMEAEIISGNLMTAASGFQTPGTVSGRIANFSGVVNEGVLSGQQANFSSGIRADVISGAIGSFGSGLFQNDLNVSGQLVVGGTSGAGMITIYSSGNVGDSRAIVHEHGFTGATGAAYIIRRYRGSAGTPSAVLSGDGLLHIITRSYDGNAFSDTTSFAFEADVTHTSGNTAGRIILYTTASGATTVTERMRVDSSGVVMINRATPGNGFLSVAGKGDFTSGVVVTDMAAAPSAADPNGTIVILSGFIYVRDQGSWKKVAIA